MSDKDSGLRDELAHWYGVDMFARKEQRAAWLQAEVAYISGMIHRTMGMKSGDVESVLQIGAGPVDVVHYWPAPDRHAIDPLAEEYKKKFHELQDEKVRYVAGSGKQLPYEDDYFDVVIIRNAFDHVDDPYQTARETLRVLKPTGALYIWIYLFSRRASLAYRTINALTKRYEAEPWAFTLSRIKRLLRENGFRVPFPAVEERPRILDDEPRFPSARWRKSLVRRILDFSHKQAFECVAFPAADKNGIFPRSPFEIMNDRVAGGP